MMVVVRTHGFSNTAILEQNYMSGRKRVSK